MALEWYCGAGGRTHVVHLASGKHTKNYGKPTFSVGQPALFMAILNSYMKLPEGKCYRVSKVFFSQTMARFGNVLNVLFFLLSLD